MPRCTGSPACSPAARTRATSPAASCAWRREDIGLADPAALPLAIAASQAYEQLGSPEGELALAQCAIHLASAPKSNAAYRAFGEAAARGQGERLADAAAAHPERADPADEASSATAAATRTTTTRPSASPARTTFRTAWRAQTFYRPTEEGEEAAIRQRLERTGPSCAAKRDASRMSEVELRTVSADEAELRLDRWFRRHFPALTHGRLQKLLRTGQVRVDGRRAQANARLSRRPDHPRAAARGPGSPAALRARRSIAERRRAACAALILVEDDALLVLDKPAGLAVQGGTRTRRHLDGMLAALAAGGERPRLVHRLDRDTSGILVVARTAGGRRQAHRGVPPAPGRQALLGAGGRAARPRRRDRIDQPARQAGAAPAASASRRDEDGPRRAHRLPDRSRAPAGSRAGSR